jgi:hypothetical protein
VEITDDGFVQLKVVPAEGEPVAVRFDVFELHNDLCAVRTRHQEDANACNRALVAYLKGKGFPDVSQAAAVRVVREVAARVDDLLGKGGTGSPPRGSPGSTDSPPPAGPPGG